MGGKRAKGAWPCASSRTVMPKDQMSASALYLRNDGRADLSGVAPTVSQDIWWLSLCCTASTPACPG
jgi:hypothetical protein